MGSNHQLPCGFERRDRTPKRAREDDDMISPSRFAIAPVEWRVSVSMLNSVLVEINGDVTQIDVGAMRIGTYRESITCEADTIIFQGTTATVLRVNLVLPTGNMSVLWTGKALHVDAKYTITDERFSYWNHPTVAVQNALAITVTARGEDNRPVSLWHANRSYVVRFEDHFSAIVIPREVYYPLRLASMREFMEALFPRSASPASSRSSDSPYRRPPSVISYESPRGPPSSPHTPEMPHSSNQ